MTKKEIVQMFDFEMKPLFKRWGFKFSKSKLQAIKVDEEITQIVFFDANYFLGKGVFQPYLRLRNERIMEIRSQVNKRYANKHFVTISKHLPEVTELFSRDDLNFLYESFDNHDLGSYVYDKTMDFYKDRFTEFMDNVGLMFFQSLNSHDDFDKWYNEGILDGKYDSKRISQDSTPTYSYISAVITENRDVEDIYSYWMNYDLYPEIKKEIESVREYLLTR